MVDPASGKVPRAPPYSGTASKRHIHVAYGDFTLCVRPSQTWPLYICFFSTLRRIAPLLDFFSLSYLDGSLHLVSLYYPILFRYVMTTSLLPGYPIRLSGNLRMCASPPGFSQLTTAFFALQLPGIHHTPFSSLDHIIASASSFPSFPFPILCQDPLPSYL